MENPMAHIDREDLGGATLEQAIGEAAGRGPYIGASFSSDFESERRKGRVQLLAASGDEGRRLDHFEVRSGRDQLRRFCSQLAVDPNLAGEDQALSGGAALGQAAFNHRHIESLPPASVGRGTISGHRKARMK
jgi:hypothetical protein